MTSPTVLKVSRSYPFQDELICKRLWAKQHDDKQTTDHNCNLRITASQAMALLQSIITLLQDTNVLLILVVTLLVIYMTQKLVTNLKLPPGPLGLPFVGFSPFMSSKPLETFDQLAKKYGDIYSVRMGSNIMVMVNDFELNKEIFMKSGDLFTGVSQDFSITNYVLGKGSNIFVCDGEIWKEQRRFLSTCLRDFGLGKLKTEKSIQEEAEVALQLLRDADGQTIDFIESDLLSCMTFNVVASVVLGKRYDYNDEKLKAFVQESAEMLSSIGTTTIVDMFPFLRYFSEKLTGMDKLHKLVDSTFEFVDEIIREHEETFDPNDIRDIIDVYLKANADMKSKENTEGSMFTRSHLLSNIDFIVTAAMDDTAVALAWMLKIVTAEQEAQKKVQEELDRVVGRQRLPSWTDRNQLPYVEAFLIEAQRVASNIPLVGPHFNLEKTTIRGYTIPKRTSIFVNNWTIHNDPKVWGDPERFRPERFLGEDGKLNKMKDYVLNFGLGHRQCIGENLARMELFIFVTAIVQSFTLTPPPNEEFNLDATQMIQRRVNSCRICALPRS